jgi:flagellar basal-body rod protein FlgB
MEPIYLFGLVNQQRSWLSARQSLVAQNVANANTPGYEARDLVPFNKVLDNSALQMAGNDPLHISLPANESLKTSGKKSDAWEVAHSGNSVSLEQEMMKAGEIHGAFTLDTNIMKAFHNMWLSSLKG